MLIPTNRTMIHGQYKSFATFGNFFTTIGVITLIDNHSPTLIKTQVGYGPLCEIPKRSKSIIPDTKTRSEVIPLIILCNNFSGLYMLTVIDKKSTDTTNI